tara:strand:- start:567 stop:686 length:120 start_codon:yes stop_codon:yes gene_type:complete
MVLEMEKTGGRLSGEPASFVWTTHLTASLILSLLELKSA